MKKYFFPLVENPYRKKDLTSAIKVIKSGRITIGKVTQKLEKKFSRKFKIKNSLMVNSGSSANLLAFQCLINPYRKNRLKPGDQVLVPSLCWSTSLWPLVQAGLKPKFIDVDLNTFSINFETVKKNISKKTKAIMNINVLGNCSDIDKIQKLAKKKNIFLVEDNCESLGSKFKNKFL